MASEPTVKKAILFVDGQNLFYAAKEAFGYTYPNYDPKKLAEHICEQSHSHAPNSLHPSNFCP